MATTIADLPSLPTTLSPPLNDREAITDAVLRAVAAFDRNDPALLQSALTQTATMEVNGHVHDGLSAVEKNCLGVVGPLNTTHFVTNVRVHINEDGKSAALTALSLAQHFPTGTGMRGTVEGQVEARLLAGNGYYVELVKEGEWRIQKFVVRSTWAEGDWGVMKRDA